MNESPKSKHEELLHSLLAIRLDFPDGAAFSSVQLKVRVEEMLALSERYLPISNARPDFVAKKIREAIDAPFSL